MTTSGAEARVARRTYYVGLHGHVTLDHYAIASSHFLRGDCEIIKLST